MRTLANILWHFPFFGFLTAFYTFLIGIFFTITVIGAPIGLGLIQHSKFLLSPFSKKWFLIRVLIMKSHLYGRLWK